MLMVNAVLTSLDVSWNSIGSEGAKALADALASGSAVLKKLDVRANRMGNTGIEVLRNSVKGREGFELLV